MSTENELAQLLGTTTPKTYSTPYDTPPEPQAPPLPTSKDVGLGQEFVSGFTGSVESGVGDFASSIGALTGSNQLRNWGTDLIDDAKKLPTSHVDVTNIKSLGDFAAWSAHSGGTLAGTVVAMLGGGGGLGLLARGAAKGGAALLGREIGKRGAAIAATSGFAAGDLATQAGQTMEHTDDATAIVSGAIAKTLLDFIPVGMVANRLGVLRGVADKVVARTVADRATGVAVNAVAGGAGANAGQAYIDLTIEAMAKGGEFGDLPDGARAAILDAAAQGLLGVAVVHSAADILASHWDAKDSAKLTPEQAMVTVYGEPSKLRFLRDEGVLSSNKPEALVELVTQLQQDPEGFKRSDPRRYHVALELVSNAGLRSKMPQIVQNEISAGLFAHSSRFGGMLSTVEGGLKGVVRMTRQDARKEGGLPSIVLDALDSLPEDAVLYRPAKGGETGQDVQNLDLGMFTFDAHPELGVHLPNEVHDGVWQHHVVKQMSVRANAFLHRFGGDVDKMAAALGVTLTGADQSARMLELMKNAKFRQLAGQATYSPVTNVDGRVVHTLDAGGTRIAPDVMETSLTDGSTKSVLTPSVKMGDLHHNQAVPEAGRRTLSGPVDPKARRLAKEWVSAMETVWKRLKLPKAEFDAVLTKLPPRIAGYAHTFTTHHGDPTPVAQVEVDSTTGSSSVFIHELAHAVSYALVSSMPRHIWQAFVPGFRTAQTGGKVKHLTVAAATEGTAEGLVNPTQQGVANLAEYATSSYVEYIRHLIQQYLTTLPEILAVSKTVYSMRGSMLDHLDPLIAQQLHKRMVTEGTWVSFEKLAKVDQRSSLLDLVTTETEPIRNAVVQTIALSETVDGLTTTEQRKIRDNAHTLRQILDSLGLKTTAGRMEKTMKRLLGRSATGALAKYPKALGQVRKRLAKQGFGGIQARRLIQEVLSKGGRVRIKDLKNSLIFRDYPALRTLLNSSPVHGKGVKEMDFLTFAALLTDGTEPMELAKGGLFIGDFRVAQIAQGGSVYTVANLVDGEFKDGVVARLRELGFAEGFKRITIDGTEYVTNQFATIKDSRLGSTVLRDDLTKYNKFMTLGATLLQWVAKNPHVTPLVEYSKIISDKIMPYKAEQNALTLATLEKMRGLPKDTQNALWGMLYDEQSNKEFITLLDGRSVMEVGEGELVGAAKERGGVDVNHGIGQRSFLTYDAVLAYRAVHEQLRGGLERVYGAFIRKADTEELRGALTEERDAFLSKPYFPLMRFGKHVLLINHRASGSRASVEFFEKLGELKARKAELAHDTSLIVHRSYRMDNSTPFAILPRGLMEAVGEKLGVSSKQREIMREISAEFSPDRSYRNFLRKRRGVAGFSRDGQRSFAAYMVSSTNFYTRIKYGDELYGKIGELADVAKELGASVGSERAVHKYFGMAEWLQEHADNMFAGDNSFAGFRSFATMMYLAGNLKSALVNLTQVPMLGFPVLASKVGAARAATEISRAYRNQLGKTSDPVLEYYMGRAKSTALLDESMLTEVAGMASTDTLQRGIGGATTNAWWKTTGLLMKPFHYAEVINRHVMFEATFQAFRAEGMHPELAYQEAISILQQTQFEYAGWNRAKFMWGKLGTVFMFWTWVQNSLALLGGVHGKREAQAAIMGLVAFGGLMSVPGTEDALKLLSYVMNSLSGGKFNDVQRSVENSVGELVGGVGSDVLFHGIASHGFGMPFVFGDGTDFDVSGSVGLGRFVPGLQESLYNGSPFDATIGRVGGSVLGAAAGVPLSMLRAVMDKDPWAMTGVLPKFIKNPLDAYHLHDKGGVQLRDGAIMKTSPFDFTKTLLHGVGLRGRDVGQVYRDRGMAAQVQQYYTAVRGTLKEQFWRSYLEDDREMKADTVRAIERFNRRVEGTPLVLGRKELDRFTKGRFKRAAKDVAGVHTPRYAAEIARMLQEGQ